MARDQLNLRVPASELVMWRQAAADRSDSLSTWVRTACNVALAQQALDSGREFDGRDVVVTPTPMAPTGAGIVPDEVAGLGEPLELPVVKPVKRAPEPGTKDCKHLRRMQTSVAGRVKCDQTKGGCGRWVR